MVSDDLRWEAKGRGQPTDGVHQQVLYSIRMGEEQILILAPAGFGPAELAKMKSGAARFSEMISAQEGARIEASATMQAEIAAKAAAKEHVHRLRNGGPAALRRSGIADLSMADLLPGETLGNSTPRFLLYLDKSRNVVVRLEEPLKPAFGGQSPTAAHDKVTKDLREADQAQEFFRKKAPDATAELNRLKGQLLEELEDLNRAAKIAFYGNAEMIAKFNKDILLRSRRSAKVAAEAAPEAAAS